MRTYACTHSQGLLVTVYKAFVMWPSGDNIVSCTHYHHAVQAHTLCGIQKAHKFICCVQSIYSRCRNYFWWNELKKSFDLVSTIIVYHESVKRPMWKHTKMCSIRFIAFSAFPFNLSQFWKERKIWQIHSAGSKSNELGRLWNMLSMTWNECTHFMLLLLLPFGVFLWQAKITETKAKLRSMHSDNVQVIEKLME